MNGSRITARGSVLAIGALLLVAAWGWGCRSAAPFAAQEELKDVHGVIEEVNARNGWYAIAPDGDRGTRYAPDRLPDEFRKNGLRVIFSGRIGRVDPDVRSWGIPLTLTSIRLE